jgi:CHASE1-domain containing sensor protein
MTSRIGIVRLGLEAIVLIVATEALLLGWMALRASRSTSIDVVWQIALEIAVVGLWIRWRSPALRNREAASVSATAKAGRIGGSPNVLAMLLLLAGIVCTILTAHWLQRTVDAAAEAKYERQKDRLVSEVQRRFRQPVYGMMGGRGVYAAGARVDRAAWQGYVRSRDLAQEFPGVRGFGVIERVPRSDIERFVAARRADGQPDFELRTAGNFGTELYVIKYVEPLDTNRSALGLDAGSELTRRQAIEQAIWTGQPTLSGRLALVQDNEQGAGFLYMVPVYRAGVVLDTPTQREAALTAIVYAPIVASELLNGILDSIDSQLVFSLFDGEEGADHAVFSAGKAQRSSLVERLAWRPKPTVERSLDSLVIGGRQFWIRTAPAFDFWPALDYWSPSLLRVAGTCISALLALAVWLLASGGARARALAQSMTADLRRMAEVVRHTSNAVVVTDRERRILWANAGFTRLYGYSMDEAQGVTPSVLLGSGRTDPSAHAAWRSSIGPRTDANTGSTWKFSHIMTSWAG